MGITKPKTLKNKDLVDPVSIFVAVVVLDIAGIFYRDELHVEAKIFDNNNNNLTQNRNFPCTITCNCCIKVDF